MHCCYTTGPDNIRGVRFGLPTCYKSNGGDGTYEVAGGTLSKEGAMEPLHCLNSPLNLNPIFQCIMIMHWNLACICLECNCVTCKTACHAFLRNPHCLHTRDIPCHVHTDGPIIGAGTLTLASNGTMPFLGVDISPLSFQAETVDQGILRIKIGAPGRWEVPQDGLFTNTVKGMIQQLPQLLCVTSVLLCSTVLKTHFTATAISTSICIGL